MQVTFEFQEMANVMQNGIIELGEDPTSVQRNAHKESKKDFKSLFFIHQCVDVDNLSHCKLSQMKR